MQRIYLYKMVADTGGAPCVQNGLLSLAICKPMIRMKAKEGDLVFGFAAKGVDPSNRLIYVARITHKLCHAGYFRERRYAARGDCIYKHTAGRFTWKRTAQHHGPKDLKHDIGEYPHYPRACVLLSTDFRYFGQAGTAEYKAMFPRIKRAVEQLGRGHLVNHGSELRDELLAMEDWIWRSSARRVLGRPTSEPSREICHRGGSCVTV